MDEWIKKNMTYISYPKWNVKTEEEILYDVTQMWTLKKSKSQERRICCWLTRGWSGGNREMVEGLNSDYS